MGRWAWTRVCLSCSIPEVERHHGREERSVVIATGLALAVTLLLLGLLALWLLGMAVRPPERVMHGLTFALQAGCVATLVAYVAKHRRP